MTGNLSVSVSAGPAPALVTLVGECDITTAPQLLDALSTQIAGDGRLVVVNLSALTFLDAAGLHALLDARAVLAGRGSALVLACPQRMVSRILELTGAGYLIPVYQDLTGALAHDRQDQQ